MFCVDEVIIFDDSSFSSSSMKGTTSGDDTDSYNGLSDPSRFLAHVFAYLDCPPYLRKHLFPIHPDLRAAGNLPSLDLPHHLRAHEWCRYREGATLPPTSPTERDGLSTSKSSGKKESKKPSADLEPATNTQVDCGLPSPVSVPVAIPPHTRVTLRFPSSDSPAGFPNNLDAENKALKAEAVAPSAPREEGGYYWGFSVRQAGSLSKVLTEAEWEGGYDVVVGTSERGSALTDVLDAWRTAGKELNGGDVANRQDDGRTAGEDSVLREKARMLRSYQHLLLVFGGLAGLEAAVANDQDLKKLGVKEAKEMCDLWINLVPGQGSRTIRTEEAVWIGLAAFWEAVSERHKR